jgi:hypothetical protein
MMSASDITGFRDGFGTRWSVPWTYSSIRVPYFVAALAVGGVGVKNGCAKRSGSALVLRVRVVAVDIGVSSEHDAEREDVGGQVIFALW